MGEGAEYIIGAAVECQDGECGELRRVIIDSAKDAVTHLVVGSKHRDRRERLVPVDLVEATTAHDVRLRCTLARFETLDSPEETDVTAGFDPTPTLSIPVFGFRGMGSMAGAVGSFFGPARVRPHAVSEDNLSAGEGEVWSGQHVHASDGPIGHVYGLVVDAGGAVTHVLLGEGHLWGKKEVAIPVSAVTNVVDDGIYLNMTKKEIGELPSVDLERIQ